MTGPAPQSTCLAPPTNKLTLLKTAASVLNFKLGPLPDKRLAPQVDCSGAGSGLERPTFFYILLVKLNNN